jgi:hypothetical protein
MLVAASVSSASLGEALRALRGMGRCKEVEAASMSVAALAITTPCSARVIDQVPTGYVGVRVADGGR